MHPMQRVAHRTVFHTVALDNLQQGAALTVGHIVQPHLFATFRNALVIRLKHWYQFVHKSLALPIKLLASLSHLFLPELHQQRVGFLVFHFKQCVALLVGIVIACQRVNIAAIILRDDDIHQFSALLATTLYEQRVSRCHYDQRNQSDVFREAFILLFVALEVLLHAPFHTYGDEKRIAIPLISFITYVFPFQYEKRLVVTNYLRINGIVS